VLTLVGDFKTEDAIARIKKNFESFPRQPDPPQVDMQEPVQISERRASVDDPLARLPHLDIAYKTGPGNTADFYALQVLSSALQGGQSSRLYQKLVKEQEIATNVGGFVDEKRGPGAFYISATLRPGKKPADAEAIIYSEIEQLKKDSIADWELQKAKNSTRRAFINGLQSSLRRASQIGQYAVFYNDPGLVNRRLSKVTAVTKDDVRRAADQYLKPANRTVIITLPAEATPSSANGGGK
jgi:predicted Zn-dependent peptidase